MILEDSSLQIHHIGCLTDDITGVKEHYEKGFGLAALRGPISVSTQGCDVCFIQLGNSVHLELIKPHSPDSQLGILLKKGISYYHIGYLTNDIERSISSITSQGGILLDRFNSEAFNEKPCAFLYTKFYHLIELIQR